MRRIACALLAVAPTFHLSAQTTQFEFRGLHLGDTGTSQVEKEQRFDCHRATDSWSVSCSIFHDQLAGVSVFTGVMLVDRRISHLGFIFAANDFQKLLDVFSARWGSPSSLKTDEVQNRMGAKFENETAVWEFSDGLLTLERYGSDLTNGHAGIGDNRLLTLSMQRRDSVRSEAMKKDFAAPLKKP